MAAFWVVNSQFKKFIDSQFSIDYDGQMSNNYFAEYTGIEVKQFKDTLLQHMGNVKKSVAERTRQQHTEQPEVINKGRVDRYTEQCQVKSPKLDSSLDNKTTEFSIQSLEFENICLKKTIAEFQKDFSRIEAHCIALKLKYPNKSVKSRQHDQFLKEKSNEAKIKHDIHVIESINIELECKVAKLLEENEHLKA
ncbi:hypothetical protein Tco_0374826 [Tanacetum coccineum]